MKKSRMRVSVKRPEKAVSNMNKCSGKKARKRGIGKTSRTGMMAKQPEEGIDKTSGKRYQ